MIGAAGIIANVNDAITIVSTTNNLVLVVISVVLQTMFYNKSCIDFL